MTISVIVAVAKDNVIGKDNDIPWYLPADLKYFKKVTSGHHILMGRKCYQSIGRPLPKRTNVVITRNPYFIASGCVVVHSLEEAINVAKENGEEEVFIIGGGQIYDMAMPLADKVYLTNVELEVDGEIYFPEMDFAKWTLLSEESHLADEKNEHNYTFKVFERKK